MRFPGQEDPLEKGMATPLQCSCLETPRTEEPGGLQSTGPQRSGKTEQLSAHARLRPPASLKGREVKESLPPKPVRRGRVLFWPPAPSRLLPSPSPCPLQPPLATRPPTHCWPLGPHGKQQLAHALWNIFLELL